MGKKQERKKFRWFRRLTRTLVALVLLFITACFIFDHYVQFRRSDKELARIFRERNIDASVSYYNSHGRSLRFIRSGPDSLPTILMLHGSPGSISYYAGRMADTSLNKHFRILAVDRPGYGYSGFGDPEPSVEKQAAMFRPLLDSLAPKKKPVIIVGSSYGSSVACRIAMDYPHLWMDWY